MKALIFLFFGIHCLSEASEIDSIKSTVLGHLSHIAKVPQNANVHVLDPYVSQHLASLKQTGISLTFGTPDYPKEEILKALSAYLDANPGFYDGYEKEKITHEQLKGYIAVALSTASRDKNVLELYSLSVSCLNILSDKEDISGYMKQLFDAFAENYKTQGGCFQGVRNRIFLCYNVFLINYLTFLK
jgi:hypothetical protein